MAQLHELEIVHRDLAARNVLVFAFDRERHLATSVKVSDFGLSRHVPDSYYYGGSHGVPVRWMPPEALTRRRFSDKSDVWAFGVTLWEVFMLGVTPFFLMPNDGDVIEAVTGGQRLLKPANCPTAVFEKLMRPCWQALPKDRPAFSSLVPVVRACQEELLTERTAKATAIECVICLDARATMIIVPCGHQCLCPADARVLQTQRSACCPMCQTPIERTMAVFLP